MTKQIEILISIYPKYCKRIITNKKNYEFRPFKLHSEDNQIIFWVYESNPSMQVKYKLITNNPITDMSDGVMYTDGIDNFNQIVDRNRFAYQITEVYELATPISLKELRSDFCLYNAPQNFLYLDRNKPLLDKLHSIKLSKIL